MFEELLNFHWKRIFKLHIPYFPNYSERFQQKLMELTAENDDPAYWKNFWINLELFDPKPRGKMKCPCCDHCDRFLTLNISTPPKLSKKEKKKKRQKKNEEFILKYGCSCGFDGDWTLIDIDFYCKKQGRYYGIEERPACVCSECNLLSFDDTFYPRPKHSNFCHGCGSGFCDRCAPNRTWKCSSCSDFGIRMCVECPRECPWNCGISKICKLCCDVHSKFCNQRNAGLEAPNQQEYIKEKLEFVEEYMSPEDIMESMKKIRETGNNKDELTNLALKAVRLWCNSQTEETIVMALEKIESARALDSQMEL